jgi:hypothetical protein
MTTFGDLNSPLGLRSLPVSYSEYVELAHRTFADPKTLVFLDTNILGLPFRFHGMARKGLFKLLKIPIEEGRLFIPGWASNEFFHRSFKAGGEHGFTSNVKKDLGSLPNHDHVKQVLTRSVSDAELGAYASKKKVDKHTIVDSLVNDFMKWSVAVHNFGKDLDPDKVHEEIGRELNGRYLALDFVKHCSTVHEHAERRRANRIPPGLTDSAKGDVNRRGASVGNVDGDLALWLEILSASEMLTNEALREKSPYADELAGREFDNVIVLCEEKKEDFLYAPKWQAPGENEKKYRAKLKNEHPKILLVDPRLVSEFESRVRHRNLAFLSMAEVVGGMRLASDDNEPEIRAFILALTQQKDIARDVAGEEMEPVPESPAPVADVAISNEAAPNSSSLQGGPQLTAVDTVSDHVPGRLTIPPDALRNEKEFVRLLPDGKDKAIIEQINTPNWYVQNPAVMALSTSGLPEESGVAFVTGRAVYQAADGSAWRAASFLKDFDSWAQDTESSQAFLAGAAYEIMFDANGALRALPKRGNLHEVIATIRLPRWELARRHFVEQLEATGAKFYGLPGQPLINVSLLVKSESNGSEWVVKGVEVKIDDRSAIGVLRAGSTTSGGGWTVDWLRELVSGHLLTAESQVNVIFEPAESAEGKLQFPSDTTFDLAELRK